MPKKEEIIEYHANLTPELLPDGSERPNILQEICKELKLLKDKFNELITRFNEHEKNDK